MAVVVSIARGHDTSYPFKTTGAAEGPISPESAGSRARWTSPACWASGADLTRGRTWDAARPCKDPLAYGARRRNAYGACAAPRAARAAQGIHARARTRGHGRRSRAGAGAAGG